MTQWTDISDNITVWVDESNYIPISPAHKTYDQSGLTYDLSGNFYDWALPRTPANENAQWINDSTVVTVWS